MDGSSMLAQFDDEHHPNAWIVTFADMMTLILVFFILLYTLSDYEDKAFRAQIAEVNVLDGDGQQISVIDYATRQGRDPEPLQAVEDMLGLNPSPEVIETQRPKIFTEMESMVNSTDLSESVSLQAEGDQINLQIDGRFLFDSGKAELKDSARIIFNNLTQLFRENPDYRIAIKGHTDDLDIDTVKFPSNWELSAIRATTVLRYFIQQGLDPQRMTATGYADFLPLVPNDSPQNRARNRRVEFVLEKEKEA
ncbi:MAG: flagellar motor protein MotB [Gammaproteobacteria bacterium]|nr:flagellar motor protein MotB [Gammaproteobacteria bacterium]